LAPADGVLKPVGSLTVIVEPSGVVPAVNWVVTLLIPPVKVTEEGETVPRLALPTVSDTTSDNPPAND
jgi:hypothetical protein